MKYPIWLAGLLQALGLVAYVTLIGTFMNNANALFGPVDDKFFAPILFLSLLVTSALICALIAFTYPLILIWDKKQTVKAFKVIGFTVLWLVVFIAILFVVLMAI